MDGLTDSLLTKQFLMILSPELRQNVYSREPKSAEESAKYTDVYFKSTRMSNESADGHISRGALQHETPNGKNWRPRGSSVYPFNVRPQTAVPNQVRPCRETAGPREHSSSRVRDTQVPDFRISKAHDLTADRKQARQAKTINATDVVFWTQN